MKLLLLSVVLFTGMGHDAMAAESAKIATPSVVDNKELSDLHMQDQADRKTGNIDWSVVAPRDKARQERVTQLLRAGAARTAADYHHAAMIYQHGESTEDIRIAHALATLSMTLEPGKKNYRWLTAASFDRLLVQNRQPQWYGTQYNSDQQGWYLYPVAESAVDDEGRKAMGVPSLQEARDMLVEIAKMSNGKVRDPQPSIADLQNDSSKTEGR